MNIVDADLLGRPWYAVHNDVIGGWAAATVDKPCSEHNHEAGEGEVADFITEAVARYIVDLHNAVLGRDADRNASTPTENALLRSIVRRLADSGGVSIVDETGRGFVCGDHYESPGVVLSKAEGDLFDQITPDHRGDHVTRLFLDTEFIDRGRSGIELLSIGVVCDDGAMYYAEPAEAQLTGASRFVLDHVVPFLAGPKAMRGELDVNRYVAANRIVKPRAQIAAEVEVFAGPSPEWWAGVDHYDWKALSDLYGTLVDRPANWPIGSGNLYLLAGLAGVDPDEDLPSEVELVAERIAQHGSDWWPGPDLPDGAHHALAGALWDQALWNLIQRRAAADPRLAALVAAS